MFPLGPNPLPRHFSRQVSLLRLQPGGKGSHEKNHPPAYCDPVRGKPKHLITWPSVIYIFHLLIFISPFSCAQVFFCLPRRPAVRGQHFSSGVKWFVSTTERTESRDLVASWVALRCPEGLFSPFWLDWGCYSGILGTWPGSRLRFIAEIDFRAAASAESYFGVLLKI